MRRIYVYIRDDGAFPLPLPPSLASYCDVYFPPCSVPPTSHSHSRGHCMAPARRKKLASIPFLSSGDRATKREAALRAAAAAAAMVTFYALQNNI